MHEWKPKHINVCKGETETEMVNEFAALKPYRTVNVKPRSHGANLMLNDSISDGIYIVNIGCI
jgi:hypothetical protein